MEQNKITFEHPEFGRISFFRDEKTAWAYVHELAGVCGHSKTDKITNKIPQESIKTEQELFDRGVLPEIQSERASITKLTDIFGTLNAVFLNKKENSQEVAKWLYNKLTILIQTKFKIENYMEDINDEVKRSHRIIANCGLYLSVEEITWLKDYFKTEHKMFYSIVKDLLDTAIRDPEIDRILVHYSLPKDIEKYGLSVIKYHKNLVDDFHKAVSLKGSTVLKPFRKEYKKEEPYYSTKLEKWIVGDNQYSKEELDQQDKNTLKRKIGTLNYSDNHLGWIYFL